jgi:hypothetical protein
MKKFKKAYTGRAIRQPTETNKEFEMRHEYHTPFKGPQKAKKGGMTKSQKKVGTVMKEFKEGKLHSGKKGPVVKNPKQAIAIALSEAGMSKKPKKLVYGGVTSPVADGTQAYSSFAQQAPVMEAPVMDAGMSDPMSGYKKGGSINVGKGKDYIKDLL